MAGKLLAAILICAASALSAGTNTWTAIGPEGAGVSRIAYGAGSTVYATADSGVYRSEDGGSHWTSIKSDFFNAPMDIAVDPSDSSRLYVAAPNWPSLYVSTDGGVTLAPLSTLPTAVTQAWQVVVSANGQTIYVSSAARIFRSADRGVTWTERSPVPADPLARVTRLEMDPADTNRLYAAVYLSSTSAALLRSVDGGQNWQVALSGSPDALTVSDIAVSASNPLLVWAATHDGLYRSVDRGASWSVVLAAAVSAVAADPANPATVYASRFTGEVLRTADTGANWTDLATLDGASGQVSAIAVSPAQGMRILVGGHGGLYGTADGGSSWTAHQAGLVGGQVPNISRDSASGRIYLNSNVGGIHYLAPGAATTLPVNNGALRQFQRPLAVNAVLAQPGRLLAALNLGLGRSLDGGNSWSLIPVAPIGSQRLFKLASSASQPQTLLAAADRALYRSTDGGSLWTQVSAGLPTDPYFASVLFAPTDWHVAYAEVHDVPASGPNVPLGILRSTDGGLSWSAPGGTPLADLRLLAVDPVVATTLYGSTNTALLKSANGGETWSALGYDHSVWGSAIVGLAAHPLRPQTLYAAGVSSIGRSVDGGITWQMLRAADALPSWATYALFPDPASAETLLVGSGSSHGARRMTIAPDLILTGTAPTVPTGLNVPLVYTLPVRNEGPFDATGVRVIVQWPASAAAVTITSTSGSCVVAGNSATCTQDIFRTGADSIVTVTATPAAAGAFEVHASIAGDQSDPQPLDNAVVLQTGVSARADLTVSVTGTAAAQAGGAVAHTLTVHNAGPNAAAAPTLTFQLASALTPSSASSAQGTCSVNATLSLVTCTLADLGVGGAASVTVNSTATVAGTLVSRAEVSSSTADGSVSDSFASTSTVVTQPPAAGGSSGAGGGGGGATSPWDILALVLCAAFFFEMAQRRRGAIVAGIQSLPATGKQG